MIDHSKMKLGKKAAVHDKRTLRLADYVTIYGRAKEAKLGKGETKVKRQRKRNGLGYYPIFTTKAKRAWIDNIRQQGVPVEFLVEIPCGHEQRWKERGYKTQREANAKGRAMCKLVDPPKWAQLRYLQF